MRFLVDECTGPRVAEWLAQENHDVFSIYQSSRGIDDDEVLEKAVAEGRIVITNDKDFGEMIFRSRKSHCGVVLLRLANEKAENKIKVIAQLLRNFSSELDGNFIVATEKTVRMMKK